MKSVGLEITHEECNMYTKGLASFEAVEYWYKRIDAPDKEQALLTQELNNLALSLLKEEGELMPGVIEVLEFWKSMYLPIGIASGSSMAHIKSIIDKFNLKKYFNLVYSMDFERFGKPHPGIYISACKKLKIDPVYSVSFEDSFNGMIAAKAARMKVVSVLEKNQLNETRFDFTDLKIESLINFGPKELDHLNGLM